MGPPYDNKIQPIPVILYFYNDLAYPPMISSWVTPCLIFAVVKGKQIYVSRYSGKDFLSCGETIESACKTIGRAVTQAQWNDTICIDGTGTSRDPYPCSSGTSDPEQIYINMSLSFL